MDSLKYYVFGKKNSPLLKEYLEKFYQKLLEDLETLVGRGILENEISQLLDSENRNFILNPDVSSLVILIINEVVKGGRNIDDGVNVYVDKLKQEISCFLNGEKEKLTMNRGQKIAGTDIRLTMEDNNPYNGQEAHPEHHLTGGVLGWGEKTEKNWLLVYEKTFHLLKQLDEGIYDELNQIIKKIVPLGTARSLHNSASYKECIGHLYMGYTIDVEKPEFNNLEAIIHESSHNKLNLLMQFDPVILNDKTEKYYSAIRPDARHIHGVFLGLHAFVSTIYMVMKAYDSGLIGDDPHWLDKIVLYHIKNKFLYKVISKYARLTPLGQEVFDEIIYVMGLSDVLFKKINPPQESIERAKQRQMEHFAQVNKNYPHLEY